MSSPGNLLVAIKKSIDHNLTPELQAEIEYLLIPEREMTREEKNAALFLTINNSKDDQRCCKLVKLLLKHGADANVRQDGINALTAANNKKYKNVYLLLRRHGASPDWALFKPFFKPEFEAKLSTCMGNLESFKKYRNSPEFKKNPSRDEAYQDETTFIQSLREDFITAVPSIVVDFATTYLTSITEAGYRDPDSPYIGVTYRHNRYLEQLKKAADDNYGPAMVMYGHCHLFGVSKYYYNNTSVEENWSEAVKYFKNAVTCATDTSLNYARYAVNSLRQIAEGKLDKQKWVANDECARQQDRVGTLTSEAQQAKKDAYLALVEVYWKGYGVAVPRDEEAAFACFKALPEVKSTPAPTADSKENKAGVAPQADDPYSAWDALFKITKYIETKAVSKTCLEIFRNAGVDTEVALKSEILPALLKCQVQDLRDPDKSQKTRAVLELLAAAGSVHAVNELCVIYREHPYENPEMRSYWLRELAMQGKSLIQTRLAIDFMLKAKAEAKGATPVKESKDHKNPDDHLLQAHEWMRCALSQSCDNTHRLDVLREISGLEDKDGTLVETFNAQTIGPQFLAWLTLLDVHQANKSKLCPRSKADEYEKLIKRNKEKIPSEWYCLYEAHCALDAGKTMDALGFLQMQKPSGKISASQAERARILGLLMQSIIFLDNFDPPRLDLAYDVLKELAIDKTKLPPGDVLTHRVIVQLAVTEKCLSEKQGLNVEEKQALADINFTLGQRHEMEAGDELYPHHPYRKLKRFDKGALMRYKKAADLGHDQAKAKYERLQVERIRFILTKAPDEVSGSFAPNLTVPFQQNPPDELERLKATIEALEGIEDDEGLLYERANIQFRRLFVKYHPDMVTHLQINTEEGSKEILDMRIFTLLSESPEKIIEELKSYPRMIPATVETLRRITHQQDKANSELSITEEQRSVITIEAYIQLGNIYKIFGEVQQADLEPKNQQQEPVTVLESKAQQPELATVEPKEQLLVTTKAAEAQPEAAKTQESKEQGVTAESKGQPAAPAKAPEAQQDPTKVQETKSNPQPQFTPDYNQAAATYLAAYFQIDPEDVNSKQAVILLNYFEEIREKITEESLRSQVYSKLLPHFTKKVDEENKPDQKQALIEKMLSLISEMPKSFAPNNLKAQFLYYHADLLWNKEPEKKCEQVIQECETAAKLGYHKASLLLGKIFEKKIAEQLAKPGQAALCYASVIEATLEPPAPEIKDTEMKAGVPNEESLKKPELDYSVIISAFLRLLRINKTMYGKIGAFGSAERVHSDKALDFAMHHKEFFDAFLLSQADAFHHLKKHDAERAAFDQWEYDLQAIPERLIEAKNYTEALARCEIMLAFHDRACFPVFHKIVKSCHEKISKVVADLALKQRADTLIGPSLGISSMARASHSMMQLPAKGPAPTPPVSSSFARVSPSVPLPDLTRRRSSSTLIDVPLPAGGEYEMQVMSPVAKRVCVQNLISS